jgi:hypothetical protein
MGAGDSSRVVVQRGLASLAQLERKTQQVEQLVRAFGASITSEEQMDAVLHGLTQCGWNPLPDRRLPTGGNIDELLVGPGGVAVLDAKTWADKVRVQGGRLYAGGHPRTQDIVRLSRHVRAVEDVLDAAGLPSVPVRGFIVLTREGDRDFAPQEAQGVWVLGLDHVQLSFSNLPPRLLADTVSNATSVLDLAFPTCSLRPVPDLPSPTPLEGTFEQNLRFFYVHPWRSLRMYLKDCDGNDLGWKDLRDDDVHLACTGEEAPLAAAVLRSASLSGIGLSAEDLPRIALAHPAEEVLAQPWVSVMVGCENARRGDYHRLYGTLLVPGWATFALGHVALATGALSPAVKGRLAPGLAPAERYLRLLWERWPAHSQSVRGAGVSARR